MGRLLRAVVVVLVALVGLLAAPATPASAHAYLTTSAPADGTILDHAPEQLILRFTEHVEPDATQVEIVDGDGRRWAVVSLQLRSPDGAGAGDESPVELVAGLPTLPANTYRVSWRTLSSDDLHATTGTLVFGVQRQVAAAAAVPGPAGPGVRESVLRGLGLLGLALLLGGAALALLLGRTAPTSELRQRLLRPAAAGGAVALVSTPVLLLTQVSAGPGGLFLREATSARWLIRELGPALLLGVVLWALRTRTTGGGRVLVGLGVLGAGLTATGTALLGHPTGGALRTALVGGAHILAAAVWAGSVLVAALALVPELRAGPDRARRVRALLRAFAVLAIACVTVLAMTGLLLAGAEVSTVDALLRSPYGLLLLAKVGAAALAGLLGLRTTLRLRRPDSVLPVRDVLPARDVVPAGAVPPARDVVPAGAVVPARDVVPGPAVVPARAVVAEAVLLAGALVLAGTLAAAGPAHGPAFPVAGRIATVPEVSGQVADLVDTVTVRPNRPGRNVVTITLSDTRRPAPGPVTGVSLMLTGPDGTRAVHPVTRTSDGWTVTTDDIRTAGDWRIAVTVMRTGLSPVTAAHTWPVADEPGRTGAVVFSAAPLRPIVNAVLLAILTVVVVGLAVLAGRRLRRRGASRRARDGDDSVADTDEVGTESPPSQQKSAETRTGEPAGIAG